MAASSTVTSAANYAKSRGGLVVAAAGNCGCFDSTPANSSMISVSATDASDTLAGFSSRGAYVEVAAPGVSIYTTTWGGGYGAASGTSLASPVAAGVVALIWSVNPGLTPDQAESILKSSSVDLGAAGYDTAFGFGRVNAYEAVLQAMGAEPPAPDTTPPSVTITSPPKGSTLPKNTKIKVAATDDRGVVRIEVYIDGALYAVSNSATATFNWNTRGVAPGWHTITARAYDAAGNMGSTAVSARK